MPTVLEEISYYPSPTNNMYKANGTLTYEECEVTTQAHNTIWLGPDYSPNVGFVIDLQCSYTLTTVVLRNAHNHYGR